MSRRVTSNSILRGLDAIARPYDAFVRLWHACAEHRTLQSGLDDPMSCEDRADELFAALCTSQKLPSVPPVAALRAFDRYLDALNVAAESIRTISLTGIRYHVVRRPSGWTSRYSADRANYREYWARHHHCVPAKHHGIDIVILRTDGELHDLRFPLSALAGGFTDGVIPAWEEPSPPYRCSKLTDAGTRWVSVRQLLDEARRHGAKVVVMPELTVDETVLHKAQAWLQDEDHSLELVAAGSFHVERSGVRYGLGWLLNRRWDRPPSTVDFITEAGL